MKTIVYVAAFTVFAVAALISSYSLFVIPGREAFNAFGVVGNGAGAYAFWQYARESRP